MNHHVSVLEIDANALLYNLATLKGRLKPSTKVLAVVKAFSYGSDASLVASVIKEQVDYLAVAYTHEGIALRESGIDVPILVLHPQVQNFKQLIKAKLEPALYSFKTLHSFIELADKLTLLNYPIHLKFNTGLNRLGFWHQDIEFVFNSIKATDHVKVQSVFSHLAASEDANERTFTLEQLKSFYHITELFTKVLNEKPLYHILNTSGIINYPEGQFDMVRTGIGLYGFGNSPEATQQLKNTHALRSIISQIHQIDPGESVGYNRGFTAKNFTKTATIPIGHADGISRQLGNQKGFVSINGEKAPIIGNVCMDMIMVDITNIDCAEGDEVYIFKTQQDILQLAEATNTISYEIITAISQRVQRVLKS